MRRKTIAAVLLIISLSCTTYDQVRATNRSNLLRLAPGMSKDEVLRAMGTATVVVGDSRITNPYRTEFYRAGEDSFELLFYYTDLKATDDAITDDELTPLVLKDGKLDGWGWSYLQDVVAKYELRIR